MSDEMTLEEFDAIDVRGEKGRGQWQLLLDSMVLGQPVLVCKGNVLERQYGAAAFRTAAKARTMRVKVRTRGDELWGLLDNSRTP